MWRLTGSQVKRVGKLSHMAKLLLVLGDRVNRFDVVRAAPLRGVHPWLVLQPEFA